VRSLSSAFGKKLQQTYGSTIRRVIALFLPTTITYNPDNQSLSRFLPELLPADQVFPDISY
jgi:hypothetical protein